MPYDNNYGGNNNYGQNYNRGGSAQRNSAPRTSSFSPKQSTVGIRLANERAGRFLDVDYWSKNTTIKIGATQPGSPIDWQTVKNAQTVQVNLTFSDMNEIWDICEEIVESIKNTGTFTSAACRVGTKQDAILEISNGSNINMSPGIYLVIYKNPDASGRTNTLEYYPFASTRIMKSYDHLTGQYKEEPGKLGDFKKFFRTIKEAAKAFTMAQAHTIASVQYNDKISGFKAIAAVTAALGIDMAKELDAIVKGTPSGGSRGGSYSGQRSSGGGGQYQNRQNRYGAPRSSAFENGNQNPYGGQAQITTTLDDPVDITLPMDELSNVDMSQFS